MTNQQGAPEALRPEMLDDLIETFATAGLGRHNLMRVELPRHQWAQLAVALSRLYAENERLAALVEAQQSTTHVQNPAEIAHVAGDVSKNGAESNMAQQPAPSAAAQIDSALNDYAQAFVARVNGWTKQNGDDLPVARAVLFQAITDYARELAMASPQPSPTPQADSVTAPAAGAVAGADWPTNEMIEAGRKAAASHGPLLGNGQSLWHIFRDMLAAAPTPPAQAADSVLEDAARLDFLCSTDKVRMIECEQKGMWRVYQDEAPPEAVQHHWQAIASDWHTTPRAAIDAAIAARKQGGKP